MIEKAFSVMKPFGNVLVTGQIDTFNFVLNAPVARLDILVLVCKILITTYILLQRYFL